MSCMSLLRAPHIIISSWISIPRGCIYFLRSCNRYLVAGCELCHTTFICHLRIERRNEICEKILEFFLFKAEKLGIFKIYLRSIFRVSQPRCNYPKWQRFFNFLSNERSQKGFSFDVSGDFCICEFVIIFSDAQTLQTNKMGKVADVASVIPSVMCYDMLWAQKCKFWVIFSSFWSRLSIFMQINCELMALISIN